MCAHFFFYFFAPPAPPCAVRRTTTTRVPSPEGARDTFTYAYQRTHTRRPRRARRPPLHRADRGAREGGAREKSCYCTAFTILYYLRKVVKARSVYICANDAERRDGPGSRRWVATGPSQALVTSAGGLGTQQPRDHQGWTLGRASGSQGWTPRRMDGHSSAWLQQLQCSLLHAPPASACSPTCHWPRRSLRRVAIDMIELLALSH